MGNALFLVQFFCQIDIEFNNLSDYNRHLEIENTKEREAISYGGTNCGCPDIFGNVFTDYHGQN